MQRRESSKSQSPLGRSPIRIPVPTLLVPCLAPMHFIVALLGGGPGFFVSAGHTPCSPKATSWRSLAYPNSPGGGHKEIDVSMWELDHNVL